jgi:DinB superfamily
MSPHDYAASAAAVRELLRGGGEFVEPARLLTDLTEEQASAVPPGSPHSIAQVVAHMQWNQAGELARLHGEPSPQPEHLDDTFVAPPAGAWPGLVAEFLAGIEEAGRIAGARGEATSAQRDDTSVAYDLAETALHNAYHCGQIVLLRRIQGLWPPAGGDTNDF